LASRDSPETALEQRESMGESGHDDQRFEIGTIRDAADRQRVYPCLGEKGLSKKS
jgi:hypothetical protein